MASDTTPLSELSILITKGTTPTTEGGGFTDTGINYVKSECLSYDGSIDVSKFSHIDVATHEKLKRSQISEGDILYSIAGVNLGKCGLVQRNMVPANTNQAVAIIRVDRTRASPAFISYVLRNKCFVQFVLAGVAQSAQPNVNLAEIGRFPIPDLPIKLQQAIAYILGSLDDKIELNRRMNETLEAIARALFKSWFVDFDPVRAKVEGRAPNLPTRLAELFPDGFANSELGEIPSSWEVGSLGKLGQLTIGGDWGEDGEFSGAILGTCLRGVDLENLRKDGHAFPPQRWFKGASLERRQMDHRDVLIAGSGAGPTGRALWMCQRLLSTLGQAVYSNFCKRIRCTSPAHAVYLDTVLNFMRESGEIWEYVNGTSVPNLDAHSLLAGKLVPIPPPQLLAGESHMGFAGLRVVLGWILKVSPDLFGDTDGELRRNLRRLARPSG